MEVDTPRNLVLKHYLRGSECAFAWLFPNRCGPIFGVRFPKRTPDFSPLPRHTLPIS